MLEGATAEGQTAHLQAGLCRCRSPRPQIRTARQRPIRSACSKHVRVIEFTGRRSDLWWASSGARPVGKLVDRVGASGCGLRGQRAASRTPSEESIRRHGLSQQGPIVAVDGMHLKHMLGQIRPYTGHQQACNLRHDFPFPIRLNFHESILVHRYRDRNGEVPSYS